MVRAPALFRHKKIPVVKAAVRRDNKSMNLFLALFWLVCAAVLLAYEHFIGGAGVRIRLGDSSFSGAWLMLVLALYNLVRWWGNRSYREEQRKLEIARARQEWERRRHSTAPPSPPDPNFNFTEGPSPPSNRSITDQPPSNN